MGPADDVALASDLAAVAGLAAAGAGPLACGGTKWAGGTAGGTDEDAATLVAGTAAGELAFGA
jgi:hypothetical protein